MNKHYESVIDILGCYGFMIRVIETFETKDSLNALRFCRSLVLTSEPGGGAGTLGISWWGCAAGTLEPLTYTRVSSAEFCYPILE